MDRFADVILAPIALFSGRPLAVMLALSILAAAIGLWIALLLPAERRFVGKLNRIAKAIRAARLAGGAQERQFSEVDGIFENSDLVAPWRRYRSSVEFEDGAAESYADAAAFFSVGYLPGHGYVKWSGTLGGVFLTVGLFFTFVGLSAALLQMGGDGHGSLNPAQLKIAVEGILAVSSVKFITSIAGILAYIFWSVVARQQSSTQVHAEEHLLAEIRALSTYVAPEMLLRRQLRVAERQNAQFASMAEILGHRVDAALGGSLEALPQAIAQSVSSSVTAAFSPIREEISAVNARIGEANASVAESAGAAFGNLWRDGIGQNLQAFGAQLSTALAALDQLPGKFRDAEAGFGGEIGRSAGELNASALRMSSALEQGQSSLAATLAAFEEKVGAIPARLAAAAEQSSQDMSVALRKTLDGAAAAATEASRNGGEIISARMAEISTSLTAVAATLTQAGQASHAHMAEGAKMLSESSENSAARLSSTIDSFSLAVNRLASRLDEVERGLDAQNRRLASAGEIVSGASDNLAKAAGAMESAAAPLTTATLTFQGAMDRFSEAAGQIHRISASGDSIGAHIAAFGAQMSQSLAAFDALPEKIKATESGFGGEIGKSAAQLTDAASRMSAAFERGQSALAQTLAGLRAATEQSSQEIGASLRQSLDGAAVAANEASRAGGEIMSARMGEMSQALTSVAALLAQAGQTSHERMAEGAKMLSESSETSAVRLSSTIGSFSHAVDRLGSRLDEVERGLDAQNRRLANAGEIVSGASDNLAKAAGAMESAAAPLTTATLSFQGAMDRFSDAAGQIRQISASGDSIGAHIAAFGTQMSQSLAAFDALPEKIKATESGFGGEIGKSAAQLTDAASRMSAAFERGQSALAQTLAGFQAKIEAIPASIAAASEKSSQEIGAKVRQALDDATSIANEASRSGADIMASRLSEITRALATAAVKLQAASEASGGQLQASHENLASGVAEGVKIIAATAEDSAAKLSHTVDSFAGAVLCLSSKLGEVVDGLDAQNARLEKAGVVVSGASNTLAMAAGSVAKAATPLTTASKSFQGAMEKFSGAADQIVKVSESGQSVADRIERTATAAQQALGSHAENFRDVERSVAQTLTGLVRGVQDLGQEISACIATYDNEIAKSIGSLEAALLDVGDIVDDRAAKRVAAEAR